jgi:hypothetical protein
MPTQHDLDVQLFEAYARAGLPVPAELPVTGEQFKAGGDRPAVVHAIRALLLGAVAGLGALAVLHLWPRRPDRHWDDDVPKNAK